MLGYQGLAGPKYYSVVMEARSEKMKIRER